MYGYLVIKKTPKKSITRRDGYCSIEVSYLHEKFKIFASITVMGFWILDFGFWIDEARVANLCRHRHVPSHG
jgi:hypothetical protein